MSGGTVFLVDDDESLLRASTRFLRASGFQVSAFQSATDFVLHHDIQIPGCAVLDVALGDCNGLDLHCTLNSERYSRPTIFITGRGDIATSVRAMKAGAMDFLTKPVPEKELVCAIRKAIEFDLHCRDEGARAAALSARIATLTPREREVFARMVEGRLNRQIALEMKISEKTVKVHRGQVMTKMGANSLFDLVRIMGPYRMELEQPGRSFSFTRRDRCPS